MEHQDRRSETYVAQRQSIMALVSANIPTREIARILNISQRTVHRWTKRGLETESLENRKRSGAPRRTTKEEYRQVIQTAIENSLTTAVHIKMQTGLIVGAQTLRNRLHEVGLHHRTPTTKPFLTHANKEERLGFALQYYPKEASFLQCVVFCDEKTFASDEHGSLHCWRRDNTRLVHN